jgi:hypothetical protein
MAAKTGTYTLIAKTTVAGTSTTTVTFSSIPSTYTDLIIVEQATASASAYSSIYFNTDNASTNYSRSYLFGSGSVAFSNRDSNTASFLAIDYISSGTTANCHIYQINDYANTTTYKTLLARYNLINDGVGLYVGLWRSTAAINAITFVRSSGTYTAGSTYSLYGIEAGNL